MSSTPNVNEFDPTRIPFQWETLNTIEKYDYQKNGVLELLLSGSVGSAKSILLAHLIIRHVLNFKHARVCIGRRSLPDLKETIFQKILEHLEGSDLIEGVHYKVNLASTRIRFYNKSEIISKSWADGKVKKFRSLELSMLVIEELTENDNEEFYKEAIARVGRLPHVPHQIAISATNPDSPTHWAYKRFKLNINTPNKIYDKDENIRVFYSKTRDNPFLPDTYIRSLEEKYDSRMSRRMLYGEWIEISGENIYYNYLSERNFLDKKDYVFNLAYPLDLMFDFNIAVGKPMSMAIGQFIDDVFHVAKDVIVEGARTEKIMEEIASTGILDLKFNSYRVFGDASGKYGSSKSIHSDYDIIMKFLSNYRRKSDNKFLNVILEVPESNPPIRDRHNVANGLFLNKNNKVRFFIYKDASRSDDGFRNTKPLKGSYFLEDDTFVHQHVTTAITYWTHYITTYGSEQMIINIG